MVKSENEVKKLWHWQQTQTVITEGGVLPKTWQRESLIRTPCSPFNTVVFDEICQFFFPIMDRALISLAAAPFSSSASVCERACPCVQGERGNTSTCTAVLFEVGQLRGAAVVDGGASKGSEKRTKQMKGKKKKMKGDKRRGRGTSNGEKRRREGEQEEGEFCLSSETVDTTGVWLQSRLSNERGRTEK